MKIFSQLNDFRTIRTRRKQAIEKAWVLDPVRHKQLDDDSWIDVDINKVYKTKDGVYKGPMRSYDYSRMCEILNDDSDTDSRTYGVLCGYNGLIVVDVDSPVVAKQLENHPFFSSTFAVRSGGKKLPHYYFRVEPYAKVTRYNNSHTGNRMIDVQATSCYVIGPGSRINVEGEWQEYSVINDVPIVQTSYDEVIRALEEAVPNITRVTKKTQSRVDGDESYTMHDPMIEEIFMKASCDMVLADAGVDISSNPGDTPFANSVGKKCLHRSGHLWFDHHIQEGGNVITLYSRVHNVSFNEAKSALAERIGLSKKILHQTIRYLTENRKNEATELLANTIKNSMSIKTVIIDKDYEMYRYDVESGLYTDVETFAVVLKECRKLLKSWYTRPRALQVIDKIAADTHVDAVEFFKQLPEHLIPVNNGILDISQMPYRLIDYSPEHNCRVKLMVDYVPGADCPATKYHLNLVLDNQDDRLSIQELYGSLLIPDYRFQKAFIFYGEGGNGKGAFITQMRTLVGANNYINVSLKKMEKNQFIVGSFLDKMANLADDIGCETVRESQIFKQLTGGSAVTAERKFKEPVTFVNRAKMVFSANKMPKFDDHSKGMLRRWIVVPFVHEFIPSMVFKKLLAENALSGHVHEKIAHYEQRMCTPSEMSGVLNWALEGMERLKAQGDFSKQTSYDEVNKFFLYESNSAYRFVKDLVVAVDDDKEYVRNDDLFEFYCQFCDNHKDLSVESMSSLKSAMRTNGFVAGRKQVMGEGKLMVWRKCKVVSPGQ